MPPKTLVPKPPEAYYRRPPTHQNTLFEAPETWRDEWRGMPEFVQEKVAPYATITVRFATKEHLNKFGQLVDQNLTNRTKSIWFPAMVRGLHAKKRYRDEP